MNYLNLHFCNVWTVAFITVFQHNWHKFQVRGISEAVFNKYYIQTVRPSSHFQLMFPLLRHYCGKRKRAVWGNRRQIKPALQGLVPSLDTERTMPSLWSFQRTKAVSGQFTIHSMETEGETAAVSTTRNHHSPCIGGLTWRQCEDESWTTATVLKSSTVPNRGPSFRGRLAYFGPPFSTWSRINHIFRRDWTAPLFFLPVLKAFWKSLKPFLIFFSQRSFSPSNS